MAPFTSLTDAFSWIESFTNFEKLPPRNVRDLKLERMVDLLERNGNPHNLLKTIHIAGSKGKGSTASFLAGIMTSAGFKTGLYTSPHVSSYTERITVAGKPFPIELYLSQAESIRSCVEGIAREQLAGDWEPTTFELLTLLAFKVFREAGCTWGVVETGIGGRLDATNIIRPEAVILTPIEKEHTDILGETITQIAGEKGGIIKEKTPVFCASQQYPEASAVFKETARRMEAPFYPLNDEVSSLETRSGREGSDMRVAWKDGSVLTAHLNLLGDFQGENAALAAACARHLLRPYLPLKKLNTVLQEGISSTALHGRMELVQGTPPVVLDGAHTAVSVKRCGENFARVFSGKRILLFGSVTGKDWEGMARAVAPLFDMVIISTPGTFKKSNPRLLLSVFEQYHDKVELIPIPEQALERACSEAGTDGAVLVTGSFYMIGEFKNLLL